MRKQLYQIATFKKALASSLILVLFLVGCAHNLEGKYDNLTTIEGYKNIVLMIGDGMGENHIKVAEAFNQARSTITEEAEISGWMTTASLSSSITDSAASATAMSTGEKVVNRAIAYKNGLKLTTMSEFARAFQKGVGIIATETLTGATPAAFYAHNRKR
ncbi:MAG: alkaline phosphatase, partial [Bacilli bacterium]